MDLEIAIIYFIRFVFLNKKQLHLKTLTLLLTLAVCTLTLSAQMKIITESPSFKEPEKGDLKLLQMQNGSTAYLYKHKNSLTVQLYDSTHIKIAENKISPRFDMGDGTVEGVFDINNDIMLLFRYYGEKKKISVMRMLIDGKTALLKDERLIAEHKPQRGGFYAEDAELEWSDYSTFRAKNNPVTGNYVVMNFDNSASEKDKRIEVIIFEANHSELSRSYYVLPENGYKFTKFNDIAVFEDDKIGILANCYNTKKSGGVSSSSYIGIIGKESKVISLTELDFSNGKYINRGIIKYDNINKKIIALPAFENDNFSFTRFYLYPRLVIFNPITAKVDLSAEIPVPATIQEKAKELFGGKLEFSNVIPQDISFNKDGTFTIISEGMSYPSASNVYSTVLDNSYMYTYNIEGKLLKSQFLPKSHWVEKTIFYPFYMAKRKNDFVELYWNNQYKSFYYLNGLNSKYVFLNDIEENAEKITKGKLTNIKGIQVCDAFYYNLLNNEVIPSRSLTFGGKSNKKDFEPAMFAVSDYNDKRNELVTLKLVKGKKQELALVWLQP